MKKNITLVTGLLFVAVSSFGQFFTERTAELYTGKLDNTENTFTEKKVGDTLWYTNFNYTANWQSTANAGNTPGVDFGWQVSATRAGVKTWNITSGIAPNSSGAQIFCENGNPQAVPTGTQKTDAEWIMTFDSTFNFTGVPIVLLEFKQYGARFYDSQVIEGSIDGGTNWVEIGNNTDIPMLTSTGGSAYPNPMLRSYNVTGAFEGEALNNLRIRFRVSWGGSAPGVMYGWVIDDLKFVEGHSNDLALKSMSPSIGNLGYKYTKFPMSQTGEAKMNFEGLIRNEGSNTQEVAIKATSGSYVATGANKPLTFYETDTFRINGVDGFTIPSTIGANTIKVEAVCDSVLLATTNDALNTSIEVTPNTMAVDTYTGPTSYTTYTGYTAQEANKLFGLCNYMEVFKDGVVGGYQVLIGKPTAPATTADYEGKDLFVRLYRANGTEYEQVGETDPYVLKKTDYGKMIPFKLADAIEVIKGDDLLVCAYSYIGEDKDKGGIPLAYAGRIKNELSVFIAGEDDIPANLGGFLADDDGMGRAPVIRLDFQSYVGLDELSAVQDVTVAPNPFNATTAINVELKAAAKVSVIVSDLTGRVVQVISEEEMIAGTHAITINGSDLNAGVYNCAISVNNEVITKRIVKK